MKRESKRKPKTMQQAEGGVVQFNRNIEGKSGNYTFDSTDVVGEPVRTNIKYAMVLERYTAEEIDEMENVKRTSRKKADKEAYAEYKAFKDGCDAEITENLGEDFK